MRILWEYPGKVRIEKQSGEEEEDPSKAEEDVIWSTTGRVNLGKKPGVGGDGG